MRATQNPMYIERFSSGSGRARLVRGAVLLSVHRPYESWLELAVVRWKAAAMGSRA